VGHERLPRAPDAERAATAVPGRKIAIRGREAAMVMWSIDDSTVRSVDRMVEPAGGVAPTPVTIVWVQLKAPGDPSRATRYSSSNPDAAPGDPSGPGRFSSWYRGDGTNVMIFARRTTSGTLPSEAEVGAAVDRFITPELRAGAHQLVTLSFRVSADGRASDVTVASGENPALMAAARSALGALSFAGVPADTEMRISLTAGSMRSGPPLPRPRGPK
jgi:hypothetical protein